ncbi:MAG TPA: peptidase S10 [Bryobacteraceae bacterium]|jgi:carboxypeptidase C (cathepsin A)|nr:peptidase S10 [Bryobacteraceae bacterium]
MHSFKIVPLALSVALTLGAQRGPRPAPPAGESEAAAPAAAPAPKAEEKTSKTQHSIQIGGQTIKYTAVAGTMLLKKEDGTPTASIFYIAYTKDDADVAKRPLTFAFNGGPGSSSVWLHMGTLGPKRVVMDPEGNPTPPPYRFTDNENSLLDQTDLVFIDPVSTGYSRAIPETTAKNFHGIKGDLQSVGEFIRMYVSRHERWSSPKFLAGESYGTTRASALSEHLQNDLGINLNGIILLSSVLNFQVISFDPGNDLPYPLFLPTYTAAAWFHNKLPKDLQSAGLQKAIEESKRFASGPYTVALFKGDAISGEERASVVKNLARLTGLSPQYIEENNLRVRAARFEKELLRDQHRVVGRYDSRLEGVDEDNAAAGPEYDPSYSSVQGAFTGAWNQYVRGELKFESDLPYEILTGRVNPWNFEDYENRYVNVAPALREAMTQNASLKVFIAAGYYDLATPFYSVEYTVNHMGFDPKLRDHISLAYYEAGHMMYTQLKSLQKAKQDIAKFMASCLPAS